MTQENDELNETFVPDRPVEPPPHPHPNPIPPGRFSLTFDGFFAFDTRALENDTLWLITAFSTLNSNINPTSASQAKFLGDFHGNDLFNEINFAPFSQAAEVNPGTYGAPLKFGHALLNFGHAQDPAEYINFNAGRVLLEAVTSFDPVGGAPGLESINSDINAALNHTFADCDGCVAFHFDWCQECGTHNAAHPARLDEHGRLGSQPRCVGRGSQSGTKASLCRVAVEPRHKPPA